MGNKSDIKKLEVISKILGILGITLAVIGSINKITWLISISAVLIVAGVVMYKIFDPDYMSKGES